MSRPFKIFLLALVLLVGISASSVYLSGGDLQGRFSLVSPTAPTETVDLENAILLEAKNSTEPDFIPEIGSEQVVMKFELKAITDLMIRYIPFKVNLKGYDLAALGDPTKWKVYEMNLKTGEVDYSTQVGVGADAYVPSDIGGLNDKGIYIRMRFFGALQTEALRVNSAKDDAAGLAIVAPVLVPTSDTTNESDRLFKVNFVNPLVDLKAPHAWSWAVGDFSKTAWALVADKRTSKGLLVSE